jgi:hypothetical protein
MKVSLKTIKQELDILEDDKAGYPDKTKYPLKTSILLLTNILKDCKECGECIIEVKDRHELDTEL